MRGANAEMFVRRRDEGLLHLLKNLQASRSCLAQRFAHDGGSDAGHLDVHLEGRDALRPSRPP